LTFYLQKSTTRPLVAEEVRSCIKPKVRKTEKEEKKGAEWEISHK